MNVYLSDDHVERVHHLALGLEPLDAVRGGRLAHPVRAEVEGPLPRPFQPPRAPFRTDATPGQRRPVISRKDSCLHILLYRPDPSGQLDFRIYDCGRRYVPRRFSIDIAEWADESLDPPPPQVRRPALFPGAAYDLGGRATGLRGFVRRAGQPLRWARAVATRPGSDQVVGRGHGDDRGEFLLLVSALAAPSSEMEGETLPVEVTILGPVPPPTPNPPDLPQQDPLWDLPLEDMAGAEPNPVSSGEADPDDYEALGSATTVQLPWGRMLSDTIFDF